jgi:hypothetical protein
MPRVHFVGFFKILNIHEEFNLKLLVFSLSNFEFFSGSLELAPYKTMMQGE